MSKPDKEPDLAILMGGPKVKDEPEDAPEEMSPEEHQQALDDAGSEVMSALKGGDDKRFTDALSAFLDLRDNAPMAPESTGDDDEEDEPDHDEINL